MRYINPRFTYLLTYLLTLQVQSGMPGSPVAVRAGASLLGRRLPSRVWQHSAISAVSWRFDLRGAANTQQFNMATELLQPWDLACGTLFQSSCVIPTSAADCSDDSWREGHLFREAWTLLSVTSDMRRYRKTLTYLLTCTIPAVRNSRRIGL